MPPLRRRALTAVPALVAALAAPGVAFAADEVTCSFAAGRVTLSVRNDELGPPLVVDRLPTGEIRAGGTPCGAATVWNTDAIDAVVQGTALLDLTHPFEPGLSAEPDGIAEIELAWEGTGFLTVAGGPGADDIRRSREGLHLNGDADSDLAWPAQRPLLTVRGLGGDDLVDLSPYQGEPEDAAQFRTVFGGDGDDVLRGHDGADFLYGEDGADQITGGLGGDSEDGGAGTNLVLQAATAQVGSVAPVAVPDAGTASSSVTAVGGARALDVEVRVTLVHPDASALTLRLAHGGHEIVLAAGLQGTGYVGTVFDDDAATGVGAGSGARTGRFRPATPVRDVLGGDARGTWTLSVEDAASDGAAALLAGWSLHVVGAEPAGSNLTEGSDDVDGSGGWTTVSYAGKSSAIAVDATFSGGGGVLVREPLFPGGDVLTNVAAVVGTPFADAYAGHPEWADRFAAGAGDDVVSGHGAGDVVDCGLGSDTADFSGALAGVVLDLSGAPGGTDVVTGCEHVVGSGFADVVTGSAAAEWIETLGGGDTVGGGAGDDLVDAGEGDDELVEGASAGPNGADVLDGGAGTDRVSYLGRGGGVTVTLGVPGGDGAPGEGDDVRTERVLGTDAGDVLTGDAGPNDIDGAGGDDLLAGGDGDDLLWGGNGADTFAEGAAASGADDLNGGAGVDLVDYGARAGGVLVDVDGAADDGGADERDNVRLDVEGVSGGAGADVITGSAAANVLRGHGGPDVLTGGAGQDVVDGGAGDDVIDAVDATADTLFGGAGLDAARRDAIDVASGIEVSLPL